MGDYISILSVNNNPGGAVESSCDGRDAAGHSLNDHQRACVIVCGKHKDIAVCVKLVNRFNPSREDDIIFERRDAL